MLLRDRSGEFSVHFANDLQGVTMNVYTDPKLLDVHGALDVLPTPPLDGGLQSEQTAVSATGTDDSVPFRFAPEFAPTADERSKSESIPGRATGNEAFAPQRDPNVASVYPVKRNEPSSIADNGSDEWAMTGSNRRLPRCKRGALAN